MATTFRFNADGSGYARGLNKMRGQTKQFSGKVKGLLAGAFAFAGIGGIKTIIKDMAEIGRTAKRLGIGVEMFQKLAFSAGQTGVDTERLADAMKDLDVKLTDGIMRGGSFAELIDELGMNMEDLEKMAPDERILAFSDAIQNASGSLSRFGADEFGDAMYEMLPWLELGSQGILDLAKGVYTLSEAQIKAAERADAKIDAVTASMKAGVSIFIANFIGAFEYYVTMGTQAFTEVANVASSFGDIMKAIFTGDFSGAKTAFNNLVGDAEGALDRIKQAGNEVLDEQLAQDKAIDAAAATKKEVARRKAELDAKKRIAAIEARIAEEQLKRDKSAMTAAQRLEAAAQRRLELEEELSNIDPFRESEERSKKILEIERAKTEESKIQKEIEKERSESNEKIAKMMADAAKTAVDRAEDLADADAAIAEERDRRSEIGMTDNELLPKAQREQKALETELAKLREKGGDSLKIKEKELELEQKKTEVASLQDSFKSALDTDISPTQDPRTSIIASQLASIGGGGGVAVTTNDPLLNENKRQTQVLERIERQLQGSGGLEFPEL